MAVTYQKQTLDNGLTIVSETDPDAHTAACGYFVKTGARDEARPLMGVSHFLEHMMFKGSARRSADEVNREFDAIGASYNAFTSTEMTAFHAHVLPEYLGQAVDLLGDILRPALRQEDFDTEKGVILEEIAMYRDQPFWVLYERAMESFYGEHGLGYRVLGTDDTVGALKRDEMQSYFDARYSADNTTVALAGRLDFDAVVEQINSQCGAWLRTDASRNTAAPTCQDASFTLRDEKVSRAYLLMVCGAPSMQDESRYAAMLLSRVLGDPDNSRLHWALIEPGIAEEAQAAYDPHDGCGDLFIYASGDPSRAEQMHEIIERELDSLVDSLCDDDLERLRNKLATSVTLAGERPAGRMQRMGRLLPYLGSYISLEEELDAINRVSLDDLRDVAKRYPFHPRTVGRLLPKGI